MFNACAISSMEMRFCLVRAKGMASLPLRNLLRCSQHSREESVLSSKTQKYSRLTVSGAFYWSLCPRKNGTGPLGRRAGAGRCATNERKVVILQQPGPAAVFFPQYGGAVAGQRTAQGFGRGIVAVLQEEQRPAPDAQHTLGQRFRAGGRQVRLSGQSRVQSGVKIGGEAAGQIIGP